MSADNDGLTDLERRVTKLEPDAYRQMPVAPYWPVWPPMPTSTADPRCPICHNRYADMTNYVCSNFNCPNRITYTTST